MTERTLYSKLLLAAAVLASGVCNHAVGWAGPMLPGGPGAAEAAEIQPRHMAPGTVFRDCPQCPEMVVVPAGSFIMGEAETRRLRPVHRVHISRPFAVGRLEVTLKQWDACVDGGPCSTIPRRESIRNYRLKGQPGALERTPVIDVSWRDAQMYADWLTRITGQRYRLLTDAEWEYAARAGTTTRWFCGDDLACLDGVAWYADNSGNNTHPVGSKGANPWGLYDVHGNVWEWVEDCWYDDYQAVPSDGSASTAGDCSMRVLRGGSWGSTAWTLRSANRFAEKFHRSMLSVGFRVARTLVQ